MITELSAQNFKSWKNTGKLQIAPLTGFFGSNSSGKTSILQTLLMLKQTVERPLDWKEVIDFGDDDSLVNLGDFDDLIHGHRRNHPLRISISWKFSEKLSLPDVDEVDTLSFELAINNVENSTSEPSFSYKVGEQHFGISWNNQGNCRVYAFGRSTTPMTLFRCYGIRSAYPDIMQLFSSLQTCFENLFRSIRYLGPLREYPRRHYAWQGKHSPGVGQHGEDMVTALFSGRIQLRSLDEQIPKWLQLRALRPAVIGWGGRPCSPGCCRRDHPIRRLWRWPENHRRRYRSGLDPRLSGGGRAADPAPSVGSASAAVRVCRLTSLLDHFR